MNKKKKKFLNKIKHKYRLVILTEDSLEEKSSFRLSRFNVLMILSIATLLITAIVVSLIAFTPLKEYIPGYADFNTRQILTHQIMITDSLEQELYKREMYVENIRKILTDDVDEYSKSHYEKLNKTGDSSGNSPSLEQYIPSKEDSIIRKEFEEDYQFNLYYQENPSRNDILSNTLFYPPVEGVVTEKFNPIKGHPAVDIASSANVGIKAVLDGTVIYSDWDVNTGYVIIIQHKNNLVSVYKHNSALMKKIGKFVNAGDVIAIIGETGELSEGPHLHFELWYDGSPLNPEDYIVF